MKTPQCGKCRFFCRDKNYQSEGVCAKDGEYTRTHRVCHKLITNKMRADARRLV